MLALCMAPPQHAVAARIATEPEGLSTAERIDGVIVDADRIEITALPFAIFGTLDPREILDAYEFVAPESGEATVTLAFKSGVWFSAEPPALRVVAANSEEPVEATARDARASSTDWRAFDRMRPIADAAVMLEKGVVYIVSIEPVTETGVTTPYSVRVASQSSTVKVEGASLDDARGILRLWAGSYGQREPRIWPPIALFVTLAIAVVAVLAIAGWGLTRLVRSLASTPASPVQAADPAKSAAERPPAPASAPPASTRAATPPAPPARRAGYSAAPRPEPAPAAKLSEPVPEPLQARPEPVPAAQPLGEVVPASSPESEPVVPAEPEPEVAPARSPEPEQEPVVPPVPKPKLATKDAPGPKPAPRAPGRSASGTISLSDRLSAYVEPEERAASSADTDEPDNAEN